MKLPHNNLSYPVRILIGNSSGSGFLISHGSKLYLITAKHVIYQQDSVTKNFLPYGDKLKILCYTFLDGRVQRTPRVYEAIFETLLSDENIKSHDSADLVVIKLGNLNETLKLKFSPGVSILQQIEGSLIHYAMTGARKFEEVEITNDIFVLGYPASLSTEKMKQIDYNAPLVRKGIVAGKNYKNKTIILDCPVYGGNSGGLVLEMNQIGINTNIHLIGVVVEFVPFVDQWRNVRMPELYNTNLQNSGYSIAIPVDYIYDLIAEIVN